jgi:hypothetical protein
MRNMLKFKDFVSTFLNESGNAIEDSRPLTQPEVLATYEWVEKTLFPLIGLEGKGIDASPIGSYGKKADEITSGDIDIAVSVDKIAGVNGISMEDALQFLEDTFKKEGYSTRTAKGFEQISIGVPVGGKKNSGTAQVDFMLSTNLDWSRFMYYSPNFKIAESKYKGMYRNVLLMSIVSECMKETTKKTETGETEQYKQYVIRLEKGIYQVEKTFMGKKGSLVKTASLLHDQDKFITSTPEEVVKFAFGEGVKPAEVMTFENAFALATSPKFIHKDRLDAILNRFRIYIVSAKMPVPTEVEQLYPTLFN